MTSCSQKVIAMQDYMTFLKQQLNVGSSMNQNNYSPRKQPQLIKTTRDTGLDSRNSIGISIKGLEEDPVVEEQAEESNELRSSNIRKPSF